MPWTTPITVSVGDTWTAAKWNTGVRDNLNWVNGAHACRLLHSVNQNVPDDGAYHALAFDTESFDTDVFHDPSSNNSRITIPTGLDGYYIITGTIVYAANATGYRDARIMLNSIATGTAIGTGRNQNVGGATAARVQTITTYRLAATDYIELCALQNSGGGLNALGTGGDIDQTQLSLIYIGL
jgi:hypothetical protein